MNIIIKLKNLKYTGFLLVLFLCACEDVVEVNLETGEPKLVIDAEILWQKGTDGSVQTIQITRMTGYYNQEVPKVSGAQVHIQNSNGELFEFSEVDEAGTYTCNNFIPQLNESYTLEVLVEDQEYTASEILIPVTQINRVEQDIVNNFSEENIEVSFYFDDPDDEINFYLSDFNTGILQYPDYELTDDEFFNGNEIKNDFSDEDLKPGDIIEIYHRGISEQFYNYMMLILDATDSNPFSTPPANIHGNIVNRNNPENYALGYFRLCEANYLVYTVEEEN
ncbi:DUF4249 domain-containing protein [Abyssalbus ytuae]|uniref:DUF4249 domain-containing protein n=1 Tax=Abyssalbus ytuae TaxID=2926907 RepID=A0A9E7CTE0_9FLAO|nr:DUF4249 domain-containing protein [Abyssalbus ytuae]UOB17951.1 DUF4249 domain-containing protein [Abyssalbus ytuae]